MLVELWLQSNLDNVWYSMDTTEELAISINKSLEEIEDFTARLSTYSKTFNIPQTARNNKFFESVYLVNGANFSAQVVVNAVVKYAGADVFVGECRMVSVNFSLQGGSYEIFLTQSLPDFAATLGDVKLIDLDLTGTTHTLDYDTLVESWNYTGGSYMNYSGITGKVVYPLAHYGYDENQYYSQFDLSMSGITFSGSPLSLTQFAPWVSVRYLVDEIFNKAGFTYESSFFESEYFNGIFGLAKTTQTQGAFVSSAATQNQNVFSVEDNRTYIDFADANYDNAFFKGFIFRTELNDPLGIFSPSISFQNRGHFFTTAVAGEYKFKFGFNMAIRFSWYNLPVWVNVAIKDVDDGTIYNKIEGLAIFVGQDVQYGDIYLNATIPAGRRVALYYSRQSGAGSPDAELYINRAYWELYSSPILFGSENILLQNNIPGEITCLDYFKGLVSLFNLVVIPKGENNLYIEKWDTYFSRGTERNWSQKLDLAQGYTLFPTNALKKEYIIKYKDSTDRFSSINQQDRNQQFGTFRYISPTTFHTDTETIEIPFAPLPIATFDVQTESNILIPHLYNWNQGAETFPNQFSMEGSDIRLGFYNGLMDCSITGTSTPIWILSGATPQSHSTYPAISHLSAYEYTPSSFSDLNIGNQYDFWQIPNNNYVGFTINDIYHDFWAGRVDPLYEEDTKIFKGTFKLTPTEINSIEFNDRVYFQNAWWRLYSMNDADITDVNMVECEFLKLPYDLFEENLIPPTYEQSSPPTPVPTPSASTFTHNVYSSTNVLTMCDESATLILVYSNCSVLSAGCSVFSDSTATTPLSEGTLLKPIGQNTIYQVIEYGILSTFTTC